MLNRSVIALTAALVLGSTSAAFSYEDPENRIGDRYPQLERMSAPVTAASRPKTAAVRQVAFSGTQVEDVEGRIADRYPLLEPATKRVSAGRYLIARITASAAQGSRWEDPENKVADRYPLAERRDVARRVARVASRSSNRAVR